MTFWHCEMEWYDGDGTCWCGMHAATSKPADWPQVISAPVDIRNPTSVPGLTDCWQHTGAA